MSTCLRDGHRRIRDVVNAFDAMIADEQPADPEDLAKLRWRLIKEILQHLALQEQVALAPLSRDSRPHANMVGARFRAELDSLYEQFNNHVSYWNGHVSERDWPGYKVALRAILSAIRRRLRREEAELLPLLPAQIAPHRAPAFAERSWADEAPHFHALVTRDIGLPPVPRVRR